jgi:hypothetical protein
VRVGYLESVFPFQKSKAQTFRLMLSFPKKAGPFHWQLHMIQNMFVAIYPNKMHRCVFQIAITHRNTASKHLEKEGVEILLNIAQNLQ